MTRARTEDLVAVEAAGYRVERMDCGFGPVADAWVLRDHDGAALMIGDHGGYAPRQVDAVAEGLRRIELG